MEDQNQENKKDEQSNKDQSTFDKSKKGPISFGREGDPTKIRVERNPGEIINGMWGFLRTILSLRKDTYDVDSVVNEIQGGIEFKGYNVWILICSIIVASVGLNLGSTAVIVGAMLISPLMGPIRGIGFGVAMNDFQMLVSSVKNFGVTVGISIVVATLYFWASPLNGLNSELLGRTSPTFMDVVIAFFGGLAGVIAAAKGKNDTVIPGVAIATALMPPLCTAGFGIAHGEWTYFVGASYLFLLNSLLIALSTILFIRYIRFPKKEYVTPKIERKAQNYIIIFMVVIVAPSGYLFYKMAQRSIFESKAELFVAEIIQKTDPNMIVDPTYEYDGKDSKIHLAIQNFYADSSQQMVWKSQLENYEIEYAEIKVKQDRDFESLLDERLLGLDNRNKGVNTLAELISRKDQQYYSLLEEVQNLKDEKKSNGRGLEMDYVLRGFYIEYPELANVSIDKRFSVSGSSAIDTTYALSLQFDPTVSVQKQNDLKKRIADRFVYELKEKAAYKQDSVEVIIIK
ncbi:MAG: DUF389 domain-containing protein [Flavobacteriales bacterium]|jgi:uncharacterized hydrophobic protein (TIGR00271 family)|nr:DUF389 domain-containing protein [Flavobacteriales bacterium]